MAGNLGDLELCWRRDIERLDRRAAAALLRGSLPDGDPRALRRLLGQALPASAVDQLDDAAVLDQVAARIEAGELLAFRRRRAPGVWTQRVVIEPEPEPMHENTVPLVEQNEEEHWLQIKLVDDEGQPVPGERYRVKLPDGRVIEGRLDEHGMARVDGIDDPGSAIVTFPEAEGEEERIA